MIRLFDRGANGLSGLESGKQWFFKTVLPRVCKKTVQITGAVFGKFAAMIPIALACGKLGSLLHEMGAISRQSAHSLDFNGIDFRISQTWVLKIAELLEHGITNPLIDLREYLWTICPKIHYEGRKLTEVFIGTFLEDLIFIGFFQRKALPILSKLLPLKIGNALNNKAVRVAFTSAIFALAHGIPASSNVGVMPQFAAGLINGAIAEADDSLVIPAASHFIFDLILGADRFIEA